MTPFEVRNRPDEPIKKIVNTNISRVNMRVASKKLRNTQSVWKLQIKY